MRKLILLVHVSLDGFVAGTKGELDGFPAGEENLEFVCQLTETADAALFGRVSYQLLDQHWPTAKDLPAATSGQMAYSNWYNDAQKIVVSKTITETKSNTIIISENIQTTIAAIKKQQGRDILLFGSPSLAQLLMQNGMQLIDEYWIFINPVIFGKGIPLFNGKQQKTSLALKSTTKFSNGEIALHYTAG